MDAQTQGETAGTAWLNFVFGTVLLSGTSEFKSAQAYATVDGPECAGLYGSGT